MSRQDVFNNVIEEVDESQLKKAIDFTEHRFVSIERDKQTTDRFAKGHKTMRGACGYLSRAVESGDPFVPEFVLDLDTGERHELELFVTVAPKAAEAVMIVMPLPMAQATASSLRDTTLHEPARQASVVIQLAIDRR
jgi:hypothetical protein